MGSLSETELIKSSKKSRSSLSSHSSNTKLQSGVPAGTSLRNNLIIIGAIMLLIGYGLAGYVIYKRMKHLEAELRRNRRSSSVLEVESGETDEGEGQVEKDCDDENEVEVEVEVEDKYSQGSLDTVPTQHTDGTGITTPERTSGEESSSSFVESQEQTESNTVQEQNVAAVEIVEPLPKVQRPRRKQAVKKVSLSLVSEPVTSQEVVGGSDTLDPSDDL